MRDHGLAEVEATSEAERAWNDTVQARVRETLYMTADSFYNGGEVAGKPRVFMPYSGGVRNYRRHLMACAQAGYSGFTLRKVPAVVDHE